MSDFVAEPSDSGVNVPLTNVPNTTLADLMTLSFGRSIVPIVLPFYVKVNVERTSPSSAPAVVVIATERSL